MNADDLRPWELEADENPLTALTAAEREVLRLIAYGLSVAEIAKLRCCSEHTVKSHLGAAMLKLHVRNRCAAAAMWGAFEAATTKRPMASAGTMP